MYKRKFDACYSSEISELLDKKLNGENISIFQPCSLDEMKENSVIFICKRLWENNFDLNKISETPNILALVYEEFDEDVNFTYIKTQTPRADYVKVLHHFFVKNPEPGIHETAIVEEGAVLGRDVFIGPNVFIGEDVVVGDGCQIFNNTVISGMVIIGNKCVIKSNSTIGSEGFSFVNESHDLDHFPQIGKIVIGNNVWIGANSSIERASLDSTVIGDDVKIDDLVQVGHNSIVGKRTQITAGSIICGRVRLGNNVWVAPNVTVDSDVKVGDNAWIGMGAVVLKDVENDTVVVGNPAKPLKKRQDLRSFQ